MSRLRFATAGRALTTAVVMVIGGSSSLLACPACFGAEETSMVDGTKLGVLVLLAITLAVQEGSWASFSISASAQSASRTSSSTTNGRSSKGRREHHD
jgi:hypothetical protein